MQKTQRTRRMPAHRVSCGRSSIELTDISPGVQGELIAARYLLCALTTFVDALSCTVLQRCTRDTTRRAECARRARRPLFASFMGQSSIPAQDCFPAVSSCGRAALRLAYAFTHAVDAVRHTWNYNDSSNVSRPVCITKPSPNATNVSSCYAIRATQLMHPYMPNLRSTQINAVANVL
jgi:hypothetical protein